MEDPKVSQSLFGPRVRMAPSPTGWAHIGTARTTLFNFLYANHYGGKFVLRIEDTDTERSKKKYEKDLLQHLKWLGISWDEGPDIEGPFGPYRQSERLSIYKKYLEQLLKDGHAYYCFCSPEELEIQRQEMMSRGEPPKYPGTCSNLDSKTAKQYIKEGKSYTIRFRIPSKKIKIKDLIRGDLEFDTSLIGDIIIAKNLDEPLYNFAVVIDDYLMKISHIIRGEEHISNTPKQIVLQEALGFEIPQYAHLPMILGPDRSKLSKRHGAASLNEYKKQGYLPEAMINFIALMGWHPSSNQEFFSVQDLISQFTLERVQKAGAIFNIQKLDWLNNYYLRQHSIDDILPMLIDYLKDSELITEKGKGKYVISGSKLKVDEPWFKRLLEIELGRMNKFSDINELSDFLFKDELIYDPSLMVWKEAPKEQLSASIDKSLQILSKVKEDEFDFNHLQEIFTQVIEKDPEYIDNKGLLLWPLRVALTGKKASAGPFEVLELLGKDISLKRLKAAKSPLEAL